jgi:putative PIN family toxin of toxin-antitoxin system
MKVVLDSMLWFSYVAHGQGSRHRLIERARKAKVRFHVSEYIVDEVRRALVEDFSESRRAALLAGEAILRRAKLVELPRVISALVAADPKDDAVVQTALTAKADYLVTADKALLELKKVRDVEIISVERFAELLPPPSGRR